MTIISEQERKRIKALGVDGLTREIADGKHCELTSPYRDAVEDVLRLMKVEEETKANARRETLDAESLAVAKDANTISQEANRIAERALSRATMANIWAAISSLIAAIAAYVAYVALTKGAS